MISDLHATPKNRCPPALPELATRLPSPIPAYTQTPACVAGGGQAPGVLYHIIARGIERKRIFTDGVDRDN